MPGVDWIPGVSQAKSLVQLAFNDREGAARTQANFARECPVVSQVTSVVQAISGDKQGAIETQKRCLGTISNTANGIPVVGHLKGGVHHLFGDHEGGNEALQAATRSSVVMGSGIVVGIASGGLGAIPAGIAAGTSYDLIDSAICEKPKGFVAAVETVVNNPNAGNIFDAAAVIVGDGLAGYSGGQLGEQINPQGKINNLKASRAAKMKQLNDGMFPEGGAAKSMTSGQVTSLGNEINSLTGKIEAMKPQYLYDPKTKQVVIQRPSGGTPVVVNVANQEDGLEDDIYYVSTEDVAIQENGLDADCYVGEIEDALTPEQREEKKNSHVQMKAGKTTLKKAYPNTSTITNTDYEELNDDVNRGQDNDPRKNPTKKVQEQLDRSVWMHVRMPPEFGYTAAILTNDTKNGLMHTFVRHSNQWLHFIPGLRGLMDKLPLNIRQLIQTVQDADEKTVGVALDNLNKELQNLRNKKYVDTLLLEIQLKLSEFLKRNVTSAQYLGEGVNNKGKIQVYFKVTNSTGATEVMVVCVSNQLYPSICEFGDRRPVRTITTVFFKSWRAFQTSKIRVGKVWPKK